MHPNEKPTSLFEIALWYNWDLGTFSNHTFVSGATPK